MRCDQSCPIILWTFFLGVQANPFSANPGIDINMLSSGGVLLINPPITAAESLHNNITNLTTGADWLCYDTARRTQIPSLLEPIVINNCITLIYNMLRVSDNLDMEWRDQALPKWRLGTCNIWLKKRGPRMFDTFSEINIAWMAAKTLDTCVFPRVGHFGGWMSIGYKRVMSVKVFGRPPP